MTGQKEYDIANAFFLWRNAWYFPIRVSQYLQLISRRFISTNEYVHRPSSCSDCFTKVCISRAEYCFPLLSSACVGSGSTLVREYRMTCLTPVITSVSASDDGKDNALLDLQVPSLIDGRVLFLPVVLYDKNLTYLCIRQGCHVPRFMALAFGNSI